MWAVVRRALLVHFARVDARRVRVARVVGAARLPDEAPVLGAVARVVPLLLLNAVPVGHGQVVAEHGAAKLHVAVGAVGVRRALVGRLGDAAGGVARGDVLFPRVVALRPPLVPFRLAQPVALAKRVPLRPAVAVPLVRPPRPLALPLDFPLVRQLQRQRYVVAVLRDAVAARLDVVGVGLVVGLVEKARPFRDVVHHLAVVVVRRPPLPSPLCALLKVKHYHYLVNVVRPPFDPLVPLRLLRNVRYAERLKLFLLRVRPHSVLYAADLGRRDDV